MPGYTRMGFSITEEQLAWLSESVVTADGRPASPNRSATVRRALDVYRAQLAAERGELHPDARAS